MTIQAAFNEITEELGGTPSTDGTITGAIDALNDTLAGSNQNRGNSIEDAVRLLGENIGNGNKTLPVTIGGDTYVAYIDIVDHADTELYHITFDDGEPSSTPELKVGEKYYFDALVFDTGKQLDEITITDDAESPNFGAIPFNNSEKAFIMPDSANIIIYISSKDNK